MRNITSNKTINLTFAIIAIGLLLSFFTTSHNVIYLGNKVLSEKGLQVERHMDVLEGNAGNPWQYRVLAPYMIRVVFKVFVRLNLSNYIATAFIIFRFIQDTLIFLLSYIYYRKLYLSIPYSLIGMILLAWGMSYSNYDSDLQFNTYFDVIFYLLAGLSILKERFVWIIPITILAALNRETSGLIPILGIAIAVFTLPKGSVRKLLPVFISALLSYAAIFVGLRLFYGPQELIIPYETYPGLELLGYNLSSTKTWDQLFATLSVIPLIAFVGYRKWPKQLRVFFWVIVPIWIVIHAIGSVMAETRVFLVPQTLVFIPGALLSLSKLEDATA